MYRDSLGVQKYSDYLKSRRKEFVIIQDVDEFCYCLKLKAVDSECPLFKVFMGNWFTNTQTIFINLYLDEIENAINNHWFTVD